MRAVIEIGDACDAHARELLAELNNLFAGEFLLHLEIIVSDSPFVRLTDPGKKPRLSCLPERIVGKPVLDDIEEWPSFNSDCSSSRGLDKWSQPRTIQSVEFKKPFTKHEHISRSHKLPKEVRADLDRLVDKRHRSKFVTDAV
jgi:hypothetical protein